jgi:hypothetical protein
VFFYSFNFILILFGTIIPENDYYKKYNIFFWRLLILYFIFIIGFRSEVGGDWQQYLYHFNSTNNLPLLKFNFELTGDIAYLLLVKISVFLNSNIILVNLFSAIIVMFAIKFFCEKQKNKFISLLILYPYFILIVIMGYNRQGIAASIILLSIVFFFNRRIFLLIFSLLLATLFHKTALLAFSLLLLYPKNLYNRKIIASSIISAIVIFNLYFFIFYDSINRIIYFFIIDPHFSSDGVYLRLLYFFIPIIIFILLRDKFKISKYEDRLIVFSSLIILISSPLIITYSSLIDRILIYFTFLQVLIFLNFYAQIKILKFKTIFHLFIAVFYYFYIYIWFSYSSYSEWWLPYKFDVNIFKYIENI